MTKQKLDATAIGAAAIRTLESDSPKELRLFEDNITKDLLSQPARFFMSLMRFKSLRGLMEKRWEKKGPGVLGGLICRTRYIDDVLQSEIEKGIENIVILGAGLDSRPYRIPGIEDTKVYEVDMKPTQDHKKERIKKIFGSLPSHVTYVPIDFNTQALEQILGSKGLDISEPTFFIWEGVTQYITKKAVDSTLEYISKTAPKSSVVFTYALKSVVDGISNIKGSDYLIKGAKRAGHPWIFGLDPSNIKQFLDQYNVSLVEDVGASYYQEKYLGPIGRDLNVFEIERIAFGRVDG